SRAPHVPHFPPPPHRPVPLLLQEVLALPSTLRPPPRPTLFPYTTLFRSRDLRPGQYRAGPQARRVHRAGADRALRSLHVLVGLRSEEHTSELQSLTNLVCRLLLEKKNHLPRPLPPVRRHAPTRRRRLSDP